MLVLETKIINIIFILISNKRRFLEKCNPHDSTLVVVNMTLG